MNKSVQSSRDESFLTSLKRLKSKQRDFENSQNYEEAGKVELEIQKLKQTHKTKTVQKLKNVQRQERRSIDLIFKQELKTFEEDWDDRINNCNEKFRIQKEELNKRQIKIFETEKKNLENNTPCIFKPSAQLLNLIACKEKAVMAKKYKEAQLMAKEIEEGLEYEKTNYIEQRNMKINKQLLILRQKMEKEANVLHIRQETELNEVKKIRDLDRLNMEKKVENICRELENAQNIQVNIAKGLHTTTAGRQSPQRPNSSFRSEYSTPQKLLSRKRSSPKPSYNK